MQVLSSSNFLDLWEGGSGLHPLDRGLLALSVALPEVLPETLADWPLGRRNRALIELHCRWFGSRLQAWTSCAQCGEKMEFELDGPELMRQQKHDELSAEGTITVKEQSFRLPSSRDLAEAVREGDYKSAPARLIERCRLGTEGVPCCSAEDMEEIEGKMALADPLAEMWVALKCPACGKEWNAALDLGSFLWAEIRARAKRLLWEIHALASVYGWPETEILSLGEARRAIYLEMVQA